MPTHQLQRSQELLRRYVDSLPEARYFAEIGSTNDEALRLGMMGAVNGTVLVAESQTRGRGRLTRRWMAPPGSSLLMSLLFRPPAPFARFAGRFTMACGIALADTVRQVTSVPARLKWPNDLIVERGETWRKLAGMLSEIGGAQNAPSFLVVGIGLNVNIPPVQLPELDPNATSLQAETGRPVDRVALLAAFLKKIRHLEARVHAGWNPLDLWREHLAWLGRPVRVHTPDGIVVGVAEQVADDGALLLRLDDGRVRRFPVGDVSLRL